MKKIIIISLVVLAVLFVVYYFFVSFWSTPQSINPAKFIYDDAVSIFAKDSTTVCDDKGNRYKNSEDAKDAGLNESDYGATYCPEYLEKPAIGGDKDEHGCIGSAGYTWNEEKKKCTRSWEDNNENWVETTGTITGSEQMPDGTYAYTLLYEVVGGNVKNMDGELIQGPLSQAIFNNTKQAIKGQKIKLHYQKEEPMFYEFLEDIKFVK